MAAIPTVVGKVDPRRFFTFSHGQGSMASNAFYDSDTGEQHRLGRRAYKLNVQRDPASCV